VILERVVREEELSLSLIRIIEVILEAVGSEKKSLIIDTNQKKLIVKKSNIIKKLSSRQ
jgi:hypothetical protein